MREMRVRIIHLYTCIVEEAAPGGCDRCELGAARLLTRRLDDATCCYCVLPVSLSVLIRYSGGGAPHQWPRAMIASLAND